MKSLKTKRVSASSRLRQRLSAKLASLLMAGCLLVPLTQAQILTIGSDPLVAGDGSYGNLSLRGGVFYVPFAFDFGGGQYSLDSIQLLLVGSGSLSDFSLLATSTLGTDLTLPSSLATFSATGTVSTATIFTFHADSPSLFTSGSTYYLRMAYAGPDTDPHWVSTFSLGGSAPVDNGDPNTSGSPSGGPSGGLMALMASNGALTFRAID